MQTQDFEFSDLMMSENFTEKINVLPPENSKSGTKPNTCPNLKGRIR